MVDEVMVLAAPTDFSVGWVLYSFAKTNTAGITKSLPALPLNYTGTPVIPTVVDFKADGLSIRSGVWTDGTVTDVPGGAVLTQYQYSSQFVTSTK
jgi:hypothetical protein